MQGRLESGRVRTARTAELAAQAGQGPDFTRCAAPAWRPLGLSLILIKENLKLSSILDKIEADLFQ